MDVEEIRKKRDEMQSINPDDKRALARYLRHTKVVNVGRIAARIVRHTDPPLKIQKKRARLEKDLSKWLKFFLPAIFRLPWSPDHLVVISKVETALRTGGLFAMALPRGSGKSSISRGASLFVLLTGLRKYLVGVGATEPDAKAVVKFVTQQLLCNDLLHEYYPHVTTYARATGDKAIKARHQLRADGKSTGITWGVNEIRLPNVLDADGKPYACCGSILEVRGLTGAIRGKNKNVLSGKVLRPDFVVLDDPQTRESAESNSQCIARERIVTGDILGLAGPEKRIAAVMPCTIIQKGDLADRFLDRKLHPEWTGEIRRMINAWPTAQETLWAEYAKIYREEISEGRGFGVATEYYEAHRKAMDAGAGVAWKERIRDGELSALQTAENLLLEMHEQFYAEMQNEPIDVANEMYHIDSKLIIKHTSNVPKFIVPETARIIVAFTDINRVGLHWVVVAFDQLMTGQVVAYGKWPERGDAWRKNAPELERKQSLFAALAGLGRMWATMPLTRGGDPVRIGVGLIDRGYEPDTVHRYIKQAGLPFRLAASRGYAGHKYRIYKATLVGAPFEHAHITQSQGRQFIAHDADHWREIMQRAWLGEKGAPGGAMLYAADPRYHMAFADQLCSEVLRQKYKTDAGIRWEWGHRPGSHNDWGDAMTGCYVAAAASGLTTGGQMIRRGRRRETRKTKFKAEE